jgi:hypothetical protein
MALTPKAEDLRAPVRDLLREVQRLVRIEEAPLREIRQTVLDGHV